jgi:excisionase family DNA binding protein
MLVEELFERFISPQAAAARAGVDDSQVRRLLRDGKLVGRKIGRGWVVDVASLDAYIVSSGWHKARWRKKRAKE